MLRTHLALGLVWHSQRLPDCCHMACEVHAGLAMVQQYGGMCMHRSRGPAAMLAACCSLLAARCLLRSLLAHLALGLVWYSERLPDCCHMACEEHAGPAMVQQSSSTLHSTALPVEQSLTSYKRLVTCDWPSCDSDSAALSNTNAPPCQCRVSMPAAVRQAWEGANTGRCSWCQTMSVPRFSQLKKARSRHCWTWRLRPEQAQAGADSIWWLAASKRFTCLLATDRRLAQKGIYGQAVDLVFKRHAS